VLAVVKNGKYNYCRAALLNKARNAEGCDATALQENDKSRIPKKAYQLLKRAGSAKFFTAFICAHEMCIQMLIHLQFVDKPSETYEQPWFDGE
jgi:hypothetical protein